MKNLFEKFFKREAPVNYIIAEYKPIKTNKLTTEVQMTEYDTIPAENSDEMDIDRIHQRN